MQFHLISPLDRFFGGTGGTGGTAQDLVRTGGTGGWDRWDRHCLGSCWSHGSAIFHGGPTGPTYQSHQTLQNGLEYHQYHRSHPCTRLSCLADEKRLYRVTNEYAMASLSWASIFEQLQAIGVEVPAQVPQGNDGPAARAEHAPPRSKPNISDAPLPRQPPRADSRAPKALTTILAAAQKAGVKFMERVTDGELIVEGLDQLAPVTRQKLQAQWEDVHRELLPDSTSTASRDLLAKLGVELVYVDTEGRAAAEVQRVCGSGRTLGLDLETAPRPEFLPVTWPIAITKDGRRSKTQVTMET